MGAVVRRPWLCGLLLAWVLLVSPLVMAVVLLAIPLPEALKTALVLMSAAPPIVGGAAIAMLIGLDGALAVVIALSATLLAPLTLPPLSLLLLGLELEIGLLAFM